MSGFEVTGAVTYSGQEASIDFARYRGLYQELILPTSGMIPPTQELSDVTKDAVIDRMAASWRAIAELAERPRFTPEVATVIEERTAAKRWLLSHHGFIPLFALTADCLNAACESVRRGDMRGAQKWLELACQLRCCCGALCVYGVDFVPCASIYKDCIRSMMPPGFTGFEIREREFALEPAIQRFKSVFHTGDEQRVKWTAADARYRELHNDCKLRAVPEGVSLAVQYLKEHGERPPITEEAFREYDAWFRVARSSEIKRLDFLLQLLEVIERVVADIGGGHRLEAGVLADLRAGFWAAVQVFGLWIGPIGESSRHYPSSLVGYY